MEEVTARLGASQHNLYAWIKRYSKAIEVRTELRTSSEAQEVKVVEFGEYSERDVMFAERLTFTLHNFKTKELAYRCIAEVLTVMNGNLLKYCGDPVASKCYLDGIARPNL